jgi:hypothetical protein
MEENTDCDDQKKYLEYCKAFWKLVTERHSYITGGNSECEHFGKDFILDAERSNCNCETCNTHNMLKLTRTLFMLTGEKQYADYYENTFVNAILASVNRETGMTTYFQPMATGCFKTYCNIDVNKNYFWCCTGTGLENFTKLGDSLYFYADKSADEKPMLLVNQYVSSEVNWNEKGVVLSQTSSLPEVGKVELCFKQADLEFTLALRIPDWVACLPEITLNGEAVSVTKKDCELGFVYITRSWKDGDLVELKLPMEVRAFNLADNPKAYAFKYGPVVLAAELGRDDKMKLRQVGVQCDVCANKIVRGLTLALNGNYGGTSGLKPLATETLLVKEPVEEFMKNINSHMKKLDGLKFELDCCDFIFSPYYRINNQRYGIYWLYVTELPKQSEADDAEKELAKYTFIEGIGVGYGTQTEGNETTAPYMQESGTGSVGEPHELTRYAKDGGSFSYVCKVNPDKKNYLQCNFLRDDNGKRIIIKAGDTLIADYILSCDGSKEKFFKLFEIPESLTKGKDGLRIDFSAARWSDSARLAAPLNTLFLGSN